MENVKKLQETRMGILAELNAMKPPTLSTRILRRELIDELNKIDAQLLAHGVNNFL